MFNQPMGRYFMLFAIFITLLATVHPLANSSSLSNVSEKPLRVIEGKITPGDTLSESLERNNVSLRSVNLIVSSLKPFVNFRRMKEVTYRYIADGSGEMIKFIYEVSPVEVYNIAKGTEGQYAATREAISLETYLIKVDEDIHSSLTRAVLSSGERSSLANAIADVLAGEIDFARDVRSGDHFKVVVEKVYKGNLFINYGKIQAVEYRSGNRAILGILFKNQYYDRQGRPLQRAFLKTPLSFVYISSGFIRKRKHPIMGGILPHLGIDYAAPVGTPVWAVAEGIVTSCGRHKGYGKQVVVRHPNGYRSYYSHLSRYGAGIKKGIHVRQKQIIGYVGSTGISTGPHLDYRLSKRGQFINSAKETFPRGTPIKQKDRGLFSRKKNEVLAWLDDGKALRKRVDNKRQSYSGSKSAIIEAMD